MIQLDKFSFLRHFSDKLYSRYNGKYWGGVGVENIIDENLFNELDNGASLAAITGSEESTSSYLVFDIDGKEQENDLAEQTYRELFSHLDQLGITPTVFYSGRKGYHLYIFIDKSLSLFTLRNVGFKLLEKFDTDLDIEVFPKQTSLDWSKEIFGNHLKLPLSIHPITQQVAYQVTDYVCNSHIKLTDIETEIVSSVSVATVVEYLEPIFTEAHRHNLAMAVTGFLKTNGVKKETTQLIFTRLVKSAGGDIGDINHVIDSTYENNGIVAGLTYCPQIDSKISNILHLFVTSLSPFATIDRDIIQSRLKKGPIFLKVKSVSAMIMTYIRTNYAVFNDGSFFYMVSNTETITDSNGSFTNFIHKLGLNVADSFSRQVIASLSNTMLVDSVSIEKSLFSNYSDGVLTVYKDNNRSVQVDSNSIKDEKTLYPTNGSKEFDYIHNTNKNLLTNLLGSFGLNKSDTDLVLTWLISQFFIELLNTKPILLVSGQPGSGKTTLANVLLKLIESIDSTSTALSSDYKDIVASLTSHKMLVLDNVEYLDSKNIDFINSVVTGTSIEYRKLYTTNEKILIKPKCSICITSAYEQFNNDGALTSRIVNIVVPKRESYGIESEFYKLLKDNYSKLMSNILDVCRIVVVGLSKNMESHSKIRMTDFAMIGRILQSGGVITTDVEQTIINRQLAAKKDNVYYKIFIEIGGKSNIEFTTESIAIRYLSKANIYGIKVNAGNLKHRLLSTGLFEQLSNGNLICTL